MSENTKIEWCDRSWSPWRGCTKVSAGCANCYAETLSKRNPAVLGQWGKGKPRVLAKNWNEPGRWNRNPMISDFTWVPGIPHELRKYHRATVFPSLCDWLDDEVPVEWLARFLKLIHDTPNLRWLLLTKRPENWRRRMDSVANGPDEKAAEIAESWTDCHDMPDRGAVPLNVWIGTSVEDQPNAVRRIPELLKIPAVGRFLSLEPLLGPVDLTDLVVDDGRPGEWHVDCLDSEGLVEDDPDFHGATVDWLIGGGESGHGARPCNVEWIRSLVKQGREADVPVFVKQLGARPKVETCCCFHRLDCRWKAPGPCGNCGNILPMKHLKGGDPSEWPDDLHVREYPEGLR